MRISTIAMDNQLQPRVVINDGLRDECTALMQQSVRFPPVVVFHQDGAHLPAAGFHCVHAARVAGPLVGPNMVIGTRPGHDWMVDVLLLSGDQVHAVTVFGAPNTRTQEDPFQRTA